MQPQKKENTMFNDDIWERLKKSPFRSRFSLKEKDKTYIQNKGIAIIKSHADDFINKRLSAAYPKNDGKQTPMHGHPVFIAQHATGCCCRSCLEKWHHIPKGKELTSEEKIYIVNIIMEWIKCQIS